jgi:hypothetical protein
MKREVKNGDIESEERDEKKKKKSPGREESKVIQKGMASIKCIL